MTTTIPTRDPVELYRSMVASTERIGLSEQVRQRLSAQAESIAYLASTGWEPGMPPVASGTRKRPAKVQQRPLRRPRGAAPKLSLAQALAKSEAALEDALYRRLFGADSTTTTAPVTPPARKQTTEEDDFYSRFFGTEGA